MHMILSSPTVDEQANRERYASGNGKDFGKAHFWLESMACRLMLLDDAVGYRAEREHGQKHSDSRRDVRQANAARCEAIVLLKDESVGREEKIENAVGNCDVNGYEEHNR